MTDNDALARGTFSSSIADVLELARRDIARTQTDFLGRMNACLMDYEGICDEHPDGDFGHDRQEADDAISGLAGLALAQLMMLRGEDEPLDPPTQDEVEAVAVAVAQSTPQPGAVVNQCLAELGDAEPLVVSKEDDGWAVRTLSAWRLLHRAADDALPDEIARLRGALRDASVSLWWAARQMKGNCTGSAVDAVNLAAGNASSAAALTGRQG